MSQPDKGVRQFRHWLTFCINSARSVPDALDPTAACILENVRDKLDALVPRSPASCEGTTP